MADLVNGVTNGERVVNGEISDYNNPNDSSHDMQNGDVNGESASGNNEPMEPVAIVGMACRLPGGIHTPEDLWQLLVNKRTTRGTVPADRYNIEGFYHESRQVGSVNLRQGHYLAPEDKLDQFDTSFFTMSRGEVESLDPQQRLLLEVVFECMENAGQQNWRGSNTGVYVGTWGDDWLDLKAKDIQRSNVFNITGTGDFAISNRVSYEYDLKGPSMTIKAACSSSMLGLHEACTAVLAGECTSAIVAGTNVILSPTMTIAQAEAGVLSPTGESRTFDANANGYSRGEGINAILVKKLSDAIKDNDPIRAVIRGTASNSDGRSNGMTNPRPEGHERLIRRAYEVAHLADRFTDTPFVECHGTGTQVGDPLELEAIGKLFGGEKGVHIGSIKPNVGHGEGASGVNSVIKAVMALEHKVIPPNVNFKTPNPKIKFEEQNLKVPLDPIPWPQDRPERVSVNSFGIGGANGHAIIDSADSLGFGRSSTQNRSSQLEQRPELLVFSAAHNESLKKSVADTQDYNANYPERLSDLAYTLAQRREHLERRAFCVTNGTTDPVITFADKVKSRPQLNFVFTGQGAQWPTMGKELLDDHPSFLEDIRKMAKTLAGLPEPPTWGLEEELRKAGVESNLDDALYAQPLLTAIQIALVNLLNKAGVLPASVVGHSSGEIAAAYAANILTADEAIIAGYYRGLVTKSCKQSGAMAAVGLGKAEVNLYLERGVVIACENSPQSVTLSGDKDRVEEVVQHLKQDNPGLFARTLKTGGLAYHSHHMTDVGTLYEDLLKPRVIGQTPNVPFYSSVTGKRVQEALGASYWRKNLESPVKFHSATSALIKDQDGDQLFIEVGPHSALAGPLRQIFKAVAFRDELNYQSTLVRGTNSTVSFLESIGRLYLTEVPVKFEGLIPRGTTLTDLPIYPWHHEISYWSESRITKDWRFRKFPHHEILGVRILEGNDFEPTWRNLLRLVNVPWIQDHKVLDDIVFPCAGYLAMIGEASRQITGTNDYTIRNFVIKTGLVLQDSQDTELITTLRAVRLTTTLDSPWYEFSIASHNGSVWTKHCTGQVRAGQDIQSKLLDQNREIKALPRLVSSPYTAMGKVGLNYGPTFQGLSNISAMPGSKKAVATLADPVKGEHSYQLHPTTIDHGLQLFAFAPCEGVVRHLNHLVVPTEIAHLYIRGYFDESEIRAEATATVSKNSGIARGEVVVMQHGQLLLSLAGGVFSPLEDDVANEDIDSVAAARLHWRPDMDFANLEELMIVTEKDPKSSDLVETYCTIVAIDIHHLIKPLNGKFFSEHMTKFGKWIDSHVEESLRGENKLVPNAAELAKLPSLERQALIADLRVELEKYESAPAAELISRLHDNCVGMFDGSAETLEIYIRDNGLTNVYNWTAERVDYTPFLISAGHLNPTMRILEIGAGTGGTSLVALSALTSVNGERMYSTYTYTDISSGFFDKAQERFAEYPGIEYRVLDISRDPTEQGFELGTFDLIVACNVIHATPWLKTTLTHVRKLLAPRGRFFLQELAPSASKLNNIIMGALPGWWLGEADNRPNGPNVSTERWNIELQAAGFAPIEAVVYDDPDRDRHIGMNIVAHPARLGDDFRAVTLLHLESQDNSQCLQQLEDFLLSQDFIVDRCVIGQPIPPQQDIISVLELEDPFIYELTSEGLENLKELLTDVGSSSVLWITRSSQVDVKDPRFAQSLGFARTVRSELSIPFATLELDNLDEATINYIVRVFHKLQETASDTQPDFEFILKDKVIHTGRYHWINTKKELSVVPNEQDRPLNFDIGRPGLLTSLGWSSYQLNTLLPDEVILAPKAIGLNFHDLLIAMGLVHSETKRLGLECSGVIKAVGTNVKHLKAGDRVMAMGQDLFSTETISLGEHVIKIPDSLSFDDAATMPCVYLTVIHGLIKVANMRKGETILIHSACGGVGLAAIQLCQMIGAPIYCTVGNEEKIRYLMDTFGIPRENIFNSRDGSFLPDLMRATSNRGVDVVLNSLSGELLHASWKCVAIRGKMIEIGKRDFIGRAQLDMDLFEANRSFIGVDLAKLEDHYKELLEDVISFYEGGHIKPISPVTAFEGARAEDAFRYMQQGTHIGKLVVRIPESKTGLPITTVPQKLRLRGDAAYLLAGGLGGLGLAVSTWLVESGARHLIYISRSAGKFENDQMFFRELEAQGCTVQTFPGDLANLEDVEKAVTGASKPIAGVLQLAMVLRDEKIPNMSYDDWRTAVAPKVDGTWNLHKALEKVDLDFFLLFSSISGCFGIAHQSNYASANSYLDAFVQYRHSLGLPASAIDIGSVGDVGYVVNNPTVQDSLRAAGMWFLSETDLLDALHLGIKQSWPSKEGSLAGSFVEQSLIAIGVRATKPMSDPSNRVIWKRDKRADILRNLETSTVSVADNSSADNIATFMKEVEASPDVLETPDALVALTKEIGVCIYKFMLQPIEELDIKKSLNSLGVDSLVTIEVRNWLRRRLAVEVSTLEILSGGTIENLGIMAMDRLKERLQSKD